MIWLGYPEEEGGASSSEAVEKAKEAIEQVTLANEKIDDCETDLISAMGELDKDLKGQEKQEWIDKLKLDGMTSDMSWAEIGDAFGTAYSTEEVSGDVAPDAFCTECGSWILSGKTECPEHGGGENIVLAVDVNKLKTLLSEIERTGEVWSQGSEKVPFGKFDSEGLERIEAVIADSACSGPLGELETETGKVIEGMENLTGAVEEIRTSGTEGAGEEASDMKSFVKGMRSLRIRTIRNVRMDGERWLVEHDIPGRSGVDSSVSSTIIQDMGRRPMTITFNGVLGPDGTREENDPVRGPALKDKAVLRKVELLKWFHKKRAPLYFASDFINRADIATKVIIRSLRFVEEEVVNHQVRFECTLVEYSDVHWETPGAAEEAMGSAGEEIEIWAQYQALDIVTGYRHRYGTDPRTKAVQSLITGGAVK